MRHERIYIRNRELMNGLESAIRKLDDYFSKLNEDEVMAIKAAQSIIEDEVLHGEYDDNGEWHDYDYPALGR